MTIFYVMCGILALIAGFIISKAVGKSQTDKTKDLLEEGVAALKRMADAEEREAKK